MLSLPRKERKAKSNTDDLIFRKEPNLLFGALLSLSSFVDTLRNTTLRYH